MTELKPCRFDTGDIVKHEPTGEEWVVAFAAEGRGLCPCGWPETLANIEDCTLVKRATDKERHDLLVQMSSMSIEDIRGVYARRVLGLWNTRKEPKP